MSDALSERIEDVLFGGLTTEKRAKALETYRKIDQGFDGIRNQIERARSVPGWKLKIPVK